MQSHAQPLKAADLEMSANDLGPLAWVLDELRKSLEGASKALKRFVRDADAARGSDLAAVDSSQLRIARQQLHQSVGALEMVDLPAPALVLRAMEAAVQKFVQQPEHCSAEAAAKLEGASFALTEYLHSLLSGKPVSAVSLFPQYRDVQELVRADRIHPADLWLREWRWLEPEFALNVSPRNYGPESRGILDHSVLRLMKGTSATSAKQLSDLSLGFAAGQTSRQPRIFWKIVAAYFEAQANGLIDSDVYVKRATSRVLLQYSSLAKGESNVSDRLTQDLVFFCGQARSSSSGVTPVLAATRSIYGLDRVAPVNYELVQFGRFDPSLLAQARKRLIAGKEAWSSFAAGDGNKLKSVVDQFGLICESLVKLHAPSEPLAQALKHAVESATQSQAPRIELAMEVATSIMYLEAAFDDLDPSDPILAERTRKLAERLEAVSSGGEPQPLERWMEELYGRVSDRQTMGSVVGELRVSLGELEKSLDAFFRDPADKVSLQAVPAQLSQMRGVLSVLGLDQAAQAVSRMRESVEQMMISESDQDFVCSAATFDQLGNNVGALSFLIDMLNYQPVLAKRLFIYDEAKGELKPVMGRTAESAGPISLDKSHLHTLSEDVVSLVEDVGAGQVAEVTKDRLVLLAEQAALAGQPALAESVRQASGALSASDAGATALALSALLPLVVALPAVPSPSTDSDDFGEEDLRDIFLEEAQEVICTGREAIAALAEEPRDLSQMTVLRRAFHTLKGSSRMVGLNQFGEAAWAFEQLLNSWLADQKAADDQFRALSVRAFNGFEGWVGAIASGTDSAWRAAPFCTTADALRLEDQYLTTPLDVPLATIASSDQRIFEPLVTSTDLAQVIDSHERPDGAPDENVSFSVDSSVGVDSSVVFGFELGSAVESQVDRELTSDISKEPVRGSPDSGPENDIPRLQETDANWQAISKSEQSAGLPRSPSDFDRTVLHVSDPFIAPFETVTVVEIERVDSHAAKGSVTNVFDNNALSMQALEDAAPLDSDSVHSAVDVDEQVRVIGDLRIGIPLYNVYLSEADEWSRRLVAEVTEWSMERMQPVADSTVALAHSLAGSSATVGFHALSEIARALEHALQQSQPHRRQEMVVPEKLFVAAAEDIRRLLHQFAAGFLKLPDPDLLSGLKSMEFSDSSTGPESEFLDSQASNIDSGNEVVWAKADQSAEIIIPEPLTALDKGGVLLVTPLPESRPQSESRPLSTSNAAVVAAPLADAPILGRVNSFGFTPRLNSADTDEDEIDAVDVIDIDLFPIFEEEAAELMPQLGGALRQWSARPDNQSARMEVLRALHTLKGSARLAGAMRLGEMAHRVESDIEQFGAEAPAVEDIDSLLARFDAMQTNFDHLRNADPSQIETGTVTLPSAETNDDHLFLIAESNSENVSNSTDVDPVVLLTGLLPGERVAGEDDTGDAGKRIVVPAPQAMVLRAMRQSAAASVRVKSQLLDRLVNQAGEVMITRSRLDAELSQLRGSLSDMSSNLNRLRQHLRDIELQAETQMQSRLAQAKEAQAGFDPLEFDRFTRVQELTRMMAESVNDVATVQRTLQRTVEATEEDLIAQARQTRELQRDLLRTRMVEFEGISDRLYRVVRQASKDSGKQVRLDLLGGTIEMDRGMLDRLTPAFEHLLRNCVAHGIENTEDRLAAGKEAVGLITVHLRHEGNDVSVGFRDDGAGLDLPRIRMKALSQGLLKAGQEISDQEAASLIFTPGFSTAVSVTELSGRGIGMDVVRSEVNALGGRIETSTVAGQGTHFKLVLPLTTAVTQVVMIRSGDLAIGVPANLIETVRRVSADELKRAYASGSFDLAGSTLPFFWSGALLQASKQSTEPVTKTTPMVVFRSADQRIAMHVDEVLGNQEVVVKNLGPQLSRLPGLAGMSVLASGAVVLIYNPVALASVYGTKARTWGAEILETNSVTGSGKANSAITPAAVAQQAQIPLILVVDDSITVRRVTQRLLQREGYRVAMAADGLQALERLQDEVPAVVLSDIEMPRMDGFDLARNIRADSRLKGLPIIMITSRIAEKHREHAMELGVDHYLGKPYSEEELISLVRHYCTQEVVAAA